MAVEIKTTKPFRISSGKRLTSASQQLHILPTTKNNLSTVPFFTDQIFDTEKALSHP
jgi:hypothetical protein